MMPEGMKGLLWVWREFGESRTFFGSGGRGSSSLECGVSVMMVTTAVLEVEP